MLKICIARHGQNEDNAKGILNGHRDFPLTEIGVAQAHEVAGKIEQAGLRFDAVLSSPLKRAFATAEIVSTTNHLPSPEVVLELIEKFWCHDRSGAISD